MIRKRNVRTRRSACLMEVAASAREWNGEPAAAPASAPTLGAATGAFAPAPPSMPGDAEIDSVAGAAPVLIDLSRSILASQLLPRTQSLDYRSKFQLAYKLHTPGTAAPREKLPSGKRPVNWAERLAVRPRGPQHTKRLLIPPARDRAAPRGRAQARRRGQAAAAPRRRPLARTSRRTRTSSAAVQRTAPP